MLLDKSIKKLSDGIKQGQFSSAEIVSECYQNIEKYNPDINALITVVDKSEVLEKAQKADREEASSPLHGLPFVVKDTYNTQGIRTTAASNVLGDYIPPYSATVYQRLLDAGAILVGKCNMDAWGHGATSENTDFGPVKNPWDITRSPGGSSGGVAAALASGMAVFGIGEDTGGSIRNPAAWCSVSGLKVSYGRVSRYGCIAYASSFDTVGPMAKNAQDCAIVLEAIAGLDPNDATSSPKPVPRYSSMLGDLPKKVTIGVPKELYDQGLDPEINTAIKNAREIFEKEGIVTREISMPMITYGLAVYYLIAPSETSSNLARYDGIRFGSGRGNFSKETVRRIMLGTYALSAGYYDAYYKKAQQGRTLFVKEYEKALASCDALLMPVTPTPPTKLGETIEDPIKNLLIDAYTVTQNPVGVPSLAVPCGFTKSGLPIGMQLVGNMFCEDLLLQIGHRYQDLTSWHTKQPRL